MSTVWPMHAWLELSRRARRLKDVNDSRLMASASTRWHPRLLPQGVQALAWHCFLPLLLLGGGGVVPVLHSSMYTLLCVRVLGSQWRISPSGSHRRPK
jgi:hypothetical protein